MALELETWLPALNAGLIVVSGVFLLVGYAMIRARRIEWHRRSMLVATVFAGLFLVVYVTRNVLIPTKLFPGEGFIRVVYFGILVPHIIVAIAVGPMALVALRRAFRGDFARHRAIARVLLPLWLFAAGSGWVVYWMLHYTA